MRARHRVLAVIVIVSGGIIPAATAAVRVPKAPAFLRPVVVSGSDTNEPGINVSNDGRTVYIDAPTGLASGVGRPTDASQAASHVYKSGDGGQRFSLLAPGLRATHLGGGDSDITVDAKTGVLSMTDLWLGSSTVSTSSDGGKTWLSNPMEGIPAHDRQWLAAAAGGRVYHFTHQLPVGLIVSRSIDGGLTYPTHQVAATVADQTGCVCPPGTLVVRPGGVLTDKVAGVYSTSTGSVKVARSVDSGTTFTNVEIWDGEGDTSRAFPVVAAPGGDRLVVVWMEVLEDSSVIWLSTSEDWGSTWTPARRLIARGTAVFPWVDARGSTIAVSVFHTNKADGPRAIDDDAPWFEKYVETRDSGKTWSPLVTVDPIPVKRGPICMDGLSCSADRELGDFQSLALDAVGRAHLTYTRSLDGRSDTEIRYARQR